MTNDDIGAATRALAEAVSVLTRSVTRSLADASHEVNTQVAGSLRAASQELSAASSRISRADPATEGTRAERTRARLVEAARKLFAERGYEAASLGDVAAEAGFTKGAVYANFAGKEDLLLAVAGTLAESDEQWPEGSGRSAAEELGPVGDAGELSEAQLAMIEIMLYAVRHPDVRPRVAGLLSAVPARAARLLVAARGGDPDHPSQADLDDALAAVAIRCYVELLAPVTADEQFVDAGRRVVQRLVEQR